MTLVEIETACNASDSTPSTNVTGYKIGSNSREIPVKPARAMIHPCVDPPLCADCTRLELSFFDPGCLGCHKLMEDPATSVPDIFAIMRQWTPQTQQAMEMLVDEVREYCLILSHCHMTHTYIYISIYTYVYMYVCMYISICNMFMCFCLLCHS